MIIIDTFQQQSLESSSKGNQTKFYKDGYWVKLDNPRSSEGLAEEFVSYFESCILGFSYVPYKSDTFLYNDREVLGCCSRSMYYDPGVSFISLRQLFRSNNISLKIFTLYPDIERNIYAVAEAVEHLTGLNIMGYFRNLLFLDCLICNEDRHYMNLGVCYSRKGSRFLPALCFDNGSSLFCVPWTYRKSRSFTENMTVVSRSARPFSKFHENQARALLLLDCKPLQIEYHKVQDLLKGYSNPRYSDSQVQLVKQVLSNRLDYYNGIIFNYI